MKIAPSFGIAAVAIVCLLTVGLVHSLEVITQVDDVDLSDFEDWDVDKWSSRFEAIDEDRFALLTPEGVLEFSNDFRFLRSYRFETTYEVDVQFVRIDSDLHILGMLWKDGFWGFKNDIHLLRYGESKPEKVWKCSFCDRPRVVHFYDYSNPLLVYAVRWRGNQELRVVQLGTDQSWRVDASGYHLGLESLGIPDPNFGLQDLLITVQRDQRRRLEFVPPTQLRLSEIDLTSKRTHIKDFENSPTETSISSNTAGRQTSPSEYGDIAKIEGMDLDHVLIGIHERELSDTPIEEVEQYADSHLWWKIDASSEGMYVQSVARPYALSCRSSDGEPIEAYVVVLRELFNHPDRSPGTRVYELRPGGYWREIFRTSQRSFGGIVVRPDHILVGFEDAIVRFDMGKDYCLSTVDQFQESLPRDEYFKNS